MASIPQISPKDPTFSILPLVFVISISALKEAVEDYKRYEMDKEENQREVELFRPDERGKNWKFRILQWQQVEVGDMVRITTERPFFPADVVLLQSSTNQVWSVLIEINKLMMMHVSSLTI